MTGELVTSGDEKVDSKEVDSLLAKRENVSWLKISSYEGSRSENGRNDESTESKSKDSVEEAREMLPSI